VLDAFIDWLVGLVGWLTWLVEMLVLAGLTAQHH
jgi:hypothetical protein